MGSCVVTIHGTEGQYCAICRQMASGRLNMFVVSLGLAKLAPMV
jgi:hypothetical protein